MTNINNTLYVSTNFENSSALKIKPVGNDYIFLFDIDDTLYKMSKDFESHELEAWKRSYDCYKVEKPEVPNFDEFLNSSIPYFESFRIHFNKMSHEVEKKRDVKYKNFISRDEALIEILKTFPFRKWCFTNGLRSRAENILDSMGLSDMFEGVICMDDGWPKGRVWGKPQEEVYNYVENILSIKNKSKVYFFDDAMENIEMGRKMGWNSILIKKEDDLIEILKVILEKINTEIER